MDRLPGRLGGARGSQGALQGFACFGFCRLKGVGREGLG